MPCQLTCQRANGYSTELLAVVWLVPVFLICNYQRDTSLMRIRLESCEKSTIRCTKIFQIISIRVEIEKQTNKQVNEMYNR
jgi:hypothetical protein